MEYVVKAAAAAVGGALFALPLLAGKPGTSVGRYVHRALSSLRILIAFWRRAPHVLSALNARIEMLTRTPPVWFVQWSIMNMLAVFTML